MWFGSLLELFSASPRRSRSRQDRHQADRRRRARRLLLEPLEERRVLAFSPFSEYAVGFSAVAQVAGDFTGDGRADLIVSSHSGVQLLRGNGDGTFQPPVSVSTNAARSVAAGDLNSDGNLDMVTNREILLGNGDGTFQSPIAIDLPPQIPTGYPAPLPQQPSSVAVGDLNGDGKLDLVVTGTTWWQVYAGGGYYGPYYHFFESGHANVLLGNGDGTVAHASVTEYPQQSYVGEALALVDLNHDNALDLLMTRMHGQQSSVLLGDGEGSLAAPGHFASGNGWWGGAVLSGDFDEDGRLDLLTRDAYNGFSLNKGRGDGSFDSPLQFTPEQSGLIPGSAAVGDINADGHLDIVFTTQRLEVTEYVPGYWGYYASAGILHDAAKVILGNGEGAFSAPITSELGSHDGLWGTFYSSVLADFNLDGRLDLAFADSFLGLVTAALNGGDWDVPASIAIADVSVVEGDDGQTSAILTVTLMGNHAGVSLDFATSDDTATAGSDYQAWSGSLTFAPGVFSRTIAVPIIGDRRGEGDESFFVTLTNPSGAVLVDNWAVVTILDNEPVISIDHPYDIDPLTVIEGDSGTTPAVFTVTLSQPYDQEVTVRYYTVTGHVNDIIAANGTLRFAPGQTSQTITVQVVGDLIHEGLEAFNVYLDNPSPNASLGNSVGYCYIEDNDPPPTVSIGDVSKNEGNSGNTTFSFVVTLSAPAGDGVFVEYATSNGTASTGNQDYVAKSGYVYFDPGQTTRTINVTVKGDTTKEADETFYVDLLYAGGATIANGRGVGTILNDDGAAAPSPPAISIGDAQVVEGNSGTRLMTFTVTLSHAASKEVRVNYGTLNGTARASDNDYVGASGTLKFAPGETTKTIAVKVKGDKKQEPDEYFHVNLSGAVNGTIGDGVGVGTILNDDGTSTAKASASSAAASLKVAAAHAAAVDRALLEMLIGHSKAYR